VVRVGFKPTRYQLCLFLLILNKSLISLWLPFW